MLELIVVVEVAGDGLSEERRQEQEQEEERQRLLAGPAHGLVVSDPDRGVEGDPGDDQNEIRDEHRPHAAIVGAVSAGSGLGKAALRAVDTI